MAKLPIFATERLILREVTEADAAAYEKNFVDYEIISQSGFRGSMALSGKWCTRFYSASNCSPPRQRQVGLGNSTKRTTERDYWRCRSVANGNARQ